MKDVLTAPFMVEMIRTATNMYDHGWDERNGGNISLMLEEADVDAARVCIEEHHAVYHAIVPLAGQIKPRRDKYC